MVRGLGGVSPSVIRAVSSGAQPANSSATRAAAARVGEVDAGDPRLWLAECHVGVQDAAGLAVGEDSLAGCEREQGSTADCPRAGRVAGVGFE